MTTHRSHVPRHVALFTHVMHMNVKSCAIHLPLEFKKKRITNESPWVLLSHQVADKQRNEAVKCFSGESVTEIQRL